VNLARQLVGTHAPLTGEHLEAARQALPRILTDHQKAAEQERRELMLTVVFIIWAGLYLLWGLVELTGCLASRCSPLLRLFGIALVDTQGGHPTRARLVWRWLLVWAPICLTFVGTFLLVTLGELGQEIAGMTGMRWRWGSVILIWMAAGLASIWGLLIAESIRQPARGPQDRMAGTVLVPR